MAARSPARWLAPLALVTVSIAVYGVVSSGLRSDDAGTSEPARTSRSQGRQASHTTEGGARRPRTYVVKPGDTLSGIAATTGVPLATLTRLNEDLDSQSLQAGQHIKLRP
jgi:LysM repeat protein